MRSPPERRSHEIKFQGFIAKRNVNALDVMLSKMHLLILKEPSLV